MNIFPQNGLPMLLAIVLLFPFCSDANEDFLPLRHDPAKHTSTWSNSPFSREVLPTQEPAPPVGDSIAKGWNLTAIDDFDGEFTVGIRNQKNQFLSLKLEEPTDGGIWVCKIERGKTLADTVVHVTDGTHTDMVVYDNKRGAANAKPKAAAAPKASPSRPRSSQPAVAPVARGRSPLAPPR
jgi:hypothetical protein